MTRKTFVATAAIVAAVECQKTRKYLAAEFAAMFKRENPNFDKSRFYAACNVES